MTISFTCNDYDNYSSDSDIDRNFFLKSMKNSEKLNVSYSTSKNVRNSVNKSKP